MMHPFNYFKFYIIIVIRYPQIQQAQIFATNFMQ